jgi:disulfide bond formation protein DsbB
MSQYRDPAVIVLFFCVAALSVALIGQYGFDLQPCQLCIYQRVPYAIAIALALLSLMSRQNRRWAAALVGLCGLAFAVNSGIALYHVGVEQHWWAGPASCSAGIGGAKTVEDLINQLSKTVKVPSCDQIQWSLFGISMAGYNLPVSAGLAVFSLAAARRGRRAQ